MPKTVALLLAVTALAGAACHHEAKPANAQTKTEVLTFERPGTPAVPPQPAGGVQVGDAMPAFEAELLDGSKFDVAGEKGNVVLLNLWATWCGPCRFEIPELEAMHKKHSADGFKVVGVSLDESGVDAVKDFVKEHDMTYPIALDPEGHLASIFRTNVIPTTVLIDRSGTVVWKRFGVVETTDKTLLDALQKALAAKG
jgi:peroxiredoxin